MFFDDLPVWGYIGSVKSGVTYLYTHIHFAITYNEDRVIGVNISTDPVSPLDISQDVPLDMRFTYSVKWEPTDTPFEHRLEKYSRESVLPHNLEVCAATAATAGTSLMCVCRRSTGSPSSIRV